MLRRRRRCVVVSGRRVVLMGCWNARKMNRRRGGAEEECHDPFAQEVPAALVRMARKPGHGPLGPLEHGGALRLGVRTRSRGWESRWPPPRRHSWGILLAGQGQGGEEEQRRGGGSALPGGVGVLSQSPHPIPVRSSECAVMDRCIRRREHGTMTKVPREHEHTGTQRAARHAAHARTRSRGSAASLLPPCLVTPPQNLRRERADGRRGYQSRLAPFPRLWWCRACFPACLLLLPALLLQIRPLGDGPLWPVVTAERVLSIATVLRVNLCRVELGWPAGKVSHVSLN
ncbi:hypothetical protein B0T11DRAFT_58234 [Plectosphaerella cucumerina]|uniref:Uncharacterized protein n=1 Tax=Plectosphaerella cucumerina TaxID=40658 RepID=A0A8K0X6R3_9PEZI|nr:hypothetical protein B0T11DRAFT_58234 [Plectosphaerella cucumerina]